MAGKYTVFWNQLKEHRKILLVCEPKSVKTIKKLISREKEKDLGWALQCKEDNNDSWIIRSGYEQNESDHRVRLTLTLCRRPLSI